MDFYAAVAECGVLHLSHQVAVGFSQVHVCRTKASDGEGTRMFKFKIIAFAFRLRL